MSSRERKRAERQKRKRRGAQRQSTPASARNGDPSESRSERRNREAREALEPLHEGERPGIVTAGAIVCATLALLSVAGYALWDVLRDDPRPSAGSIAVFVVMLSVMGWGMWRARYWAVLGFQTLLAIVMVLTALGLVGATTILQALGNILLIAVAGTLFYFMVRALARIQMPTR